MIHADKTGPTIWKAWLSLMETFSFVSQWTLTFALIYVLHLQANEISRVRDDLFPLFIFSKSSLTKLRFNSHVAKLSLDPQLRCFPFHWNVFCRSQGMTFKFPSLLDRIWRHLIFTVGARWLQLWRSNEMKTFHLFFKQIVNHIRRFRPVNWQ